MKYGLLKLLGVIVMISVALMFLGKIAAEKGWINSTPSYSIEIVTTLATVTSILFFFLQKIKKSNPQEFIQSYLLSITIKMVVGCVLILVIIFLDRAGAVTNAKLFLISYITFTVLEIWFLRLSFNKKRK